MSATDVLDDVSSAMLVTSPRGFFVKSATDATGPSDPMQTPRHNPIAGPVEPRDGRDHAEVDLAAGEQARARGGHVESERDGVGPPLESVDERPNIQVADRAEPNRTSHDVGS